MLDCSRLAKLFILVKDTRPDAKHEASQSAINAELCQILTELSLIGQGTLISVHNTNARRQLTCNILVQI